ncbi:LysE family transporter [Orrella sp. JC864]|uniref:LysE family translocator n=1 Tax=Orrella sp. JC864 TaxID=3120298 RepID=UPI00300BD87B
MTLANMLTLFGAMLVLALIPSVSVLAVVARSASSGLAHGAAAAAGIVAGDLLYIALAIFGLALLTQALGKASLLIPYAGGAYMILVGLRLWKAGARPAGAAASADASSLASSFMAGLLITLADQKVLLFYLGFLPAFMDLGAIGALDALIVMAIAVLAVGGAKLGYALLAHKAATVLGAPAGTLVNRLAGATMMAVGLYLLLAR